MAIAVNDTLMATTQLQSDSSTFSAIVPEEAFVPGANKLQVFLVDAHGAGAPTLRSAASRIGSDRAPYKLRRDEEGAEYIVTEGGESIPVTEDAVQGWLDRVRTFGGVVEMSGWAGDPKRHKPAERIVVFRNGQWLRSGRPDVQRDDVAQAHQDPSLAASGFSIQLSDSKLDIGFGTEIRLFAISDAGVASELGYPRNYRW